MRGLLADRMPVLQAAEILMVDFEMTCGPGITQDVQDIIEVGYCAVRLGDVLDSELASSLFVRPTRSAVTSFCERLTGIAPELVSVAPTFAQRSPELAAVAAGATGWASWGADQEILARQCEALGLASPFANLPHWDLKRLLTPLIYGLTGSARPRGSGAGVGLETAMRELGLTFEGRPHSGRADAYNAGRVLQEVRGRVRALVASEAAGAGPPPRTKPGPRPPNF